VKILLHTLIAEARDMSYEEISFIEFVLKVSELTSLELRQRLESKYGWSRQLYWHHKKSRRDSESTKGLKYSQHIEIMKASGIGRRQYRRMCKAYYGDYV
jgi:hypothetical protein